MNSLHDNWSVIFVSTLEVAATWWLQAGLLLLVGLFVTKVLRKPASQSVVYRVTLGAVLLLPFLTQFLTLVGVTLFTVDLRKWIALENSSSLTNITIAESAALQKSIIERDSQMLQADNILPASRSPSNDSLFAPRDVTKLSIDASQESNNEVSNVSLTSIAAPELSDADTNISIPYWQPIGITILAIWLTGSLCFLTKLWLDWWRGRSACRESVAADPIASEICLEFASRLRVKCPRVRSNPFLNSPCLIGHWRPKVLLPADTEPSTYHQVFLHELAHLRRGDWLWNLIGSTACSLLWCQPLMWWLHRQSQTVSEEICDDYVIQHGCDREGYLRQLVEIAERMLPQIAPSGVSMVGFRSKLGKRALRILDTSRVLSTQAGRWFAATTLLSMIFLTMGIALVEIGHAKTLPSDESKNAKAANSNDVQTNSMRVKKPASDSWAFQGKVLDSLGKPLADASMKVMISDFNQDQDRWIYVKTLAETRSADDGTYALTFQPEEGIGSLVAELDGFGLDIVSFDTLYELFKQGKTQLDLHLPNIKPIEGRVVDLEGNPIPEVKIQIIDVALPTSHDAITKWIAEARPELFFANREPLMHQDTRITGTAFPTRSSYNRNEIKKLETEVLTDEHGTFRINGIGEDSLVRVSFSGATIANREALIVTRDMQRILAYHHSVHDNDFTHYGASSTIIAGPTQPIEGVVVDVESGVPLSDMKVALARIGTSSRYKGWTSTVTDRDGRFQLTGAPLGGGHTVEVTPSLDQPYFKTGQKLPTTETPASLECKIALTKTKWIRGRVTDTDGKPLVATLNFYPFRDNLHAEKYINFEPRFTSVHPDESCKSNENGEFRIKAISGNAVLAASITDWMERKKYTLNLPEQLFERIGGERMPKLFHPWSASEFDAMVEVDLDPGSDEITQDLVCHLGRARKLQIVDQNGQAMNEVIVMGTTFPPRLEKSRQLTHSSLELIGMQKDESRMVALMSLDSQSGKMFIVVGSATEPLDVQLEKSALVIGRVVDSEGLPAAKLEVSLEFVPEPSRDNWSRKLEAVHTDADGKFELHLPSGGLCRVSAAYTEMGPNFSVNIRPNSGVQYDLGKLKNGDKITESESKLRVHSEVR